MLPRASGQIVAVDAEHVERDERDGDRGVAVKHSAAQQGPVWGAGLVERDQLAVEHQAAGHLPARARARSCCQERRLRTSSPFSVETIARNPSYLSSKAHPSPVGIGPGRSNIGRSTAERLLR